jgi:hypothetical protein
MSGYRVVSVVITKRTGDADTVSAFEIAERAEKSKILGWAQDFGFEITESIIIDVAAQQSNEKIVTEIMELVTRSKCDGIVAASTEYLKLAGLHNRLPEASEKIGKRIWIADLGSLPLAEKLTA